jgi:hypothetical protein
MFSFNPLTTIVSSFNLTVHTTSSSMYALTLVNISVNESLLFSAINVRAVTVASVFGDAKLTDKTSTSLSPASASESSITTLRPWIV